MFKSKAIAALLDSIIKEPPALNSDIHQNPDNNTENVPRPLAASILSSKNGAPLLSSISISRPLVFSSLTFESADAIYLEFLHQFTSVDFEKILRKSTPGSRVASDYQQKGVTNYGSINNNGNSYNPSSSQQQPHLNKPSYVTRDTNSNFDDSYYRSSGTKYDTGIEVEQSDSQDVSVLLPDAITDSHSVLELLSHYVFSCYSAFKDDFIHYRSTIDGVNYQKKSNYLKLIEPESQLESVSSNLKWFSLQIDNKLVFLNLVLSKNGEEFLLLFVTDDEYPKGLAKLKLERLEQSMKASGF